MPQAPDLYPTAAPSLGGAPEVSLPVPVEAFGGAVGQALQHLGAGVEHVGDEVWQRAAQFQDMNNRAETDKADAQFMEEAGLEHAKFGAMEGAQARNYFPTYIQNLKDIRERIRGGLSNQMSQRMFDTQSLGTLGRTIFNGAGHAAQQAHADAINSVDGRIKALQDDATATDDPAVVEGHKNKIRALSVYKDRDIKGVSDPDALREGAKIATSSLDFNVLKHMAKKDPWAAEAEFTKRKKDMTQHDQDTVQDFITNQQRVVGATNIANDVVNANKNDDGTITTSFDTIQKQVRDKAKSLAPDDPMVEQHAVAQAQTLFNQKKYNDRQLKWDNWQEIDGALQNGLDDMDKLRHDPRMASIIENMPPSEQVKIPGRINRYVAARDKVMNDRAMTTIAGMRNNDVTSFLDLDPTDPKWGLNQGQMKTVLGWQRVDKKQTNNDPRVPRALSWLRGSIGSQLQEVGVYNRTSKNTDDYDHFTGTLQQALDLWQEQHGGKPADYKAVTTEIGPEIIKRYGIHHFYSSVFGDEQKPFFSQDVPDEFAQGYRTKVDPNATDEEVYKNFVRQKLMQLYKAKTSGPTNQP